MWCAPAPGVTRLAHSPTQAASDLRHRLASFRRADLDRLEVLLQGSRYHTS
jgi:hypothetical protein